MPVSIYQKTAIAICSALVLTGAFLWQVPLNHDTAYLLLASERYLDGASLYFDQSMMNPPLVTWMHGAVVLFARMAGESALYMVIPIVLLVIGVSLFLAGRAVVLLPDIESKYVVGIVGACFFAITFAPLHDFAQRDHLFMIFSLPLIVLTGVRLQGGAVRPQLAGGIGIFAFFGIALKPHFLLLPLCLEIIHLIKTKKVSTIFRPETIALGGALAVYGLLVIINYLEYFTDVIPRYRQVFFAFTHDFYFLAFKLETQVVLMALAAYTLCRERLIFNRFFKAVLVAIIATTVIYFLQKKGWSYQRAPMMVPSLILFAGCLLSWKQMQSFSQRIGLYMAIGGIIVVMMIVYMHGPYANEYMKTVGSEIDQITEIKEGSSVYIFTTNVSVPYPMLMYRNIDPASRFNTLWMMPGLIRKQNKNPGILPKIETFTRDSILADFIAHRPVAVIVDVRDEKPYFGGISFDYLVWALQDQRFVKQWQEYKFLKNAYGFQIYVRK